MKVSGLWKAFLFKCSMELIPFWYFPGFDKVSKVSKRPKLNVFIFWFFSGDLPRNIEYSEIASNVILSEYSKLAYLVDSLSLIESLILAFALSSE